MRSPSPELLGPTLPILRMVGRLCERRGGWAVCEKESGAGSARRCRGRRSWARAMTHVVHARRGREKEEGD